MLIKYYLLFLVFFSPILFAQGFEAPNQRFVPDSLLQRLEKANLSNEGVIDVTHFQQCDAAWGGNILGTCTSTICTEGCALTSAAMLLKTLGTDADPDKLNQFLIQNSGYANGCLIIWDVAARYPGSTMQWYAMANYNLSTIKNEINAGNLVIIKVALLNSNHFMVIRGYTGNGTTSEDYIVLDPRYTYETKLNEYTIGTNPALRLFHNFNLPVSLEEENTAELNSNFHLYQNYPNPFNPITTIYYNNFGMQDAPADSPSGQNITLIVYDILGNKVAELVNEYQSPGDYSVEFNANNLSSGVYYCSLYAGGQFHTIKLVLQK